MRVAVVGVGRMGFLHLEILKSLSFEVVGICDQETENLQKAANELDLAESCLFTDATELFNQAKPELVVIATTAPSHCELVCLAAESGTKFILCEKPMAVSIAQCNRMIDTCRQHGTELAINHQMRFMDHYVTIKKMAGDLGGIHSVTVIAGNMGLAMNGTHYFEMFRYITEEKPTKAYAWFSDEVVPNPRGDMFEDRAGTLRLESESGKRFYLECGADLGHGIKTVFAGPFGQIVLDELTGQLDIAVREESYRNLPTTRYGMPAHTKQHQVPPIDIQEPTRQVVQALIQRQDYPDGTIGRMTIETLVAAYTSHEADNGCVAIDSQLSVSRTFPWA